MKIARKSKPLSSAGMTLIEILIIIFIIVVGVGGGLIIGVGIKGNQYFTQDGVLSAVQIQEPTAVRVVDTSRNVYNFSEVTVKLQSGEKETYLLDSNICFDYHLTKKVSSVKPQ
jgi:flagellar basal body-associated protein FliL